MKISRRTVLVSALPALAASQTAPPAPSAVAAPDYLAISAAQYQRNADALGKIAVPMGTEPAFVFKV